MWVYYLYGSLVLCKDVKKCLDKENYNPSTAYWSYSKLTQKLIDEQEKILKAELVNSNWEQIVLEARTGKPPDSTSFLSPPARTLTRQVRDGRLASVLHPPRLLRIWALPRCGCLCDVTVRFMVSDLACDIEQVTWFHLFLHFLLIS